MLIQFHKHASKQSLTKALHLSFQHPCNCNRKRKHVFNVLHTVEGLDAQEEGDETPGKIPPPQTQRHTGRSYWHSVLSSPPAAWLASCWPWGYKPQKQTQPLPSGGRSQPNREWWASLKRSPSFKKYKKELFTPSHPFFPWPGLQGISPHRFPQTAQYANW